MHSPHIGQIIRDLLKEKKLTQVEVSEMISMTKQGLSGILNRSSVNTDVIDRLNEALQVNIYRIIADKKEEITPFSYVQEVQPDYKTKRNNKRRVSVLIEVDEHQQQQISKIIGL